MIDTATTKCGGDEGTADFHVIDNKNLKVFQCLIPLSIFTRAVRINDFKRHIEPKCRPFANSTFNPNYTAHHVHKFLRNRQSKAGSAILLSRCCISLCKLIKNTIQLIVWNTYPCIFDRNTQRYSIVHRFLFTYGHGYMTVFYKFYGIPQQVHHDLCQTHRIRHNRQGDIAFIIHGQFYVLLIGLQGYRLNNIFD